MEKKRKLGEPAAGNGDGEVEAELTAEKRQRVIGPALPPTPAAENDNDGQRGSESDSDSDSDDEIGPGLPSACSAPRTEGKDDRLPPKEEEPTAKLPEQKSGGQRDSWMLQPPGSTDWTGRIDPTKLRNRQFQTGKSAKGAGGSGQVDSSWTETPQEKMRRLQDQVMGVAPPSDSGSREKAADKSKRDEIMRERVQKYNVGYGAFNKIPPFILTTATRRKHDTAHQVARGSLPRAARRRMTQASEHLIEKKTCPCLQELPVHSAEKW